MPGLKEIFSGLSGGLLTGVSEILAKVKADPTKVIEIQADLEKLKVNTEVEMQKLEVQLAEVHARELETVNATMRAESQSEHWMQWAWRPTLGFTLCAILVNNYILLPYFKNRGMEVISIPAEVWTALLVILGVASAGRSFNGVKFGKK